MFSIIWRKEIYVHEHVQLSRYKLTKNTRLKTSALQSLHHVTLSWSHDCVTWLKWVTVFEFLKNFFHFVFHFISFHGVCIVYLSITMRILLWLHEFFLPMIFSFICGLFKLFKVYFFDNFMFIFMHIHDSWCRQVRRLFLGTNCKVISPARLDGIVWLLEATSIIQNYFIAVKQFKDLWLSFIPFHANTQFFKEPLQPTNHVLP